MNEKTEIPMVCRHCAYSWNYKGKNPYYATCPHCLGKVKVPTIPQKEEVAASKTVHKKKSLLEQGTKIGAD